MASNKPAALVQLQLASFFVPGLVLLYLLSTSIRPFSLGYDLYNDKRILEIVLLALVNIGGFLIPQLRGQFLQLWLSWHSTTRWLVAGFFTLGCLSALSSTHPWFALTDVALHFNLLVAALLLAASFNLNPKGVLKLVAVGIFTLALLSGFIETIGILAYLNQHKLPGSADLFAYFTHPRFFNQMQSWLFAGIFLLPAIWPNKRTLWLLSIFVATYWIGLMLISKEVWKKSNN